MRVFGLVEQGEMPYQSVLFPTEGMRVDVP